MIEVYDDLFDSKTQDKIENFILDSKASWFFSPKTCDVGYEKHRCIEDVPQIGRLFKLDDDNVNDFDYTPFTNVLRYYHKKKIVRCKSNIIFQQKLGFFEEKRKVNMPHVDLYFPHMVMLYYVNDSDGDTVIYKEKHSGNGKMSFPESLTEKKRISPKRGRVVIFDGLYYHTSSSPRKNPYRCVINFDLV